jgi:hypothetical protein
MIMAFFHRTPQKRKAVKDEDRYHQKNKFPAFSGFQLTPYLFSLPQ